MASAVPAGSTQRIVESVTTAIVERRLMPGTKLAEQKIADLFKVSRTIVRQALNQLSRDHLVTLTPARGAYVATPSVDEARQVFELRSMIEGALIRQLCATITDAQLAQLREHLAREREAVARTDVPGRTRLLADFHVLLAQLRQHLAREREAVARTDVPGRTRLLADFHVLLAQLYGNAVLAQLLADLLNRSSLIALMFQSAHSAEASQREHEQIVEALAQRDARAAVRLVAHHLHSVERNLRLNPRTPDLAAALRPQD